MFTHLKTRLVALALLAFIAVAPFAIAECNHTLTDLVSWFTAYEKNDAYTHWQTIYFDEVCLLCGHVEKYLDYDSRAMPHEFAGDKCRLCGYKRSSSDEKPTQKELQSAAQQLGERALGATAVVIYGGNIRQLPATNSLDLGNVHANETYEILAVEYTLGHIWYKVNTGYKTGWVSANLVQVLPGTAVPGGANPELVGRLVVINVASGRMRSAPGTASEKVGKIYRGHCTPILDCGYDQSGKLWYKISNGHVEGWVSSGIADLK